MQIHISDQQTDLNIDPSGIKVVVDVVLEVLGNSCDEVGVHFVSSQEISRLHLIYFDDDSVTDCISFPVDSIEDYRVLGEVFICPLVAIDYVKIHPELGLSSYDETTLYLIHGLLHLLGFDDIKKKDRDLMHELQDKILMQLKEENLCLKAPQ